MMKSFIRFLFLYLPCAYGYYTLIIIFLIVAGVLDDPLAFNTDDYRPVATDTIIINDTKKTVTYHVPK